MKIRRSLVMLVAVAATACSGRPPSYAYLDLGGYMYRGDQFRVVYSYDKGNEAQVDLRITSRRTAAQASRQFTLTRGSPETLTLSPDLLPGLENATASVEWFGLSVNVQVPGNYWDGLWWAPPRSEGIETEFAVVTDREARLPVFSSVPLLEGGPPGWPNPWVQSDDDSPMEDAALQAATERGGRNLTVTKRLASATERASSRTPGLSTLNVEVHRFEVRGQFPKQVIVRGPRGGSAETIETPVGFRMLVPRVEHPPVLDVEPLAD